ncbi:phage portal protein [Shinella sp. BYT-45]|uniref:phage portal protein n=1 Tax=Shinella sp. BYT-45 TaxID=3377377 RepID=UPI00398057B4
MAWLLSEWFGSFWRPRRSNQAEPARTSSDPDRSVGIDAALQIDTVWSCVRLISETIGTLPLPVYAKDGAGGRSTATDHWLYGLVHDSPNADMTAAEFWEAAVACLCLWGNFYAEITRNASKEIVALDFLPPDKVKVKRDQSGARVYQFSDGTERRTIREERMFHIRGFGVGGDVGLSPIGYARKSLSLAIDTDNAVSSAMRSGIRPAGFLVVPGKPSAEQKKDLRETFIEPITGPAGTARAGILEQGMDWKDVRGMPPEDLQLLQGRAFNVETICRWFRVPPFMVGHTEKSTSWGTGLEQQTIAFLTYALRPYLTRIEQAIRKQLVPVNDRKTIYAEFNLEGLLRADSAGRAALYATFAQNGISTRNEIRARENLPRADGGDMLTVQSNLVPLDRLGSAASSDQQARSAFLSWLGLEEIVTSAVKSALIGHNGGPPLENEQ